MYVFLARTLFTILSLSWFYFFLFSVSSFVLHTTNLNIRYRSRFTGAKIWKGKTLLKSFSYLHFSQFICAIIILLSFFSRWNNLIRQTVSADGAYSYHLVNCADWDSSIRWLTHVSLFFLPFRLPGYNGKCLRVYDRIFLSDSPIQSDICLQYIFSTSLFFFIF